MSVQERPFDSTKATRECILVRDPIVLTQVARTQFEHPLMESLSVTGKITAMRQAFDDEIVPKLRTVHHTLHHRLGLSIQAS
jgi:hypothetical protein